MKSNREKFHSGFTLIEMAIVLVIITILIGGLAMPLSAQIEARRIAETRKTMEEAREAIMGYAMSHTTGSCACAYTSGTLDGSPTTTCSASLCSATLTTHDTAILTLKPRHFLPCPDLSGTDPEPNLDNDGVDGLTDINNGVEDRLNGTPGTCAAASGNLPWVTLATAAQDAWGNRLHYGLTLPYGHSITGFSNADPGDKQVCNTSTGGCAVGTVARDVPVVLTSYGSNGWGARTVNNTDMAAPTSADELENTDANNSYVNRVPSKPGSAAGEFDDLVSWISSSLLISRVCPGGGCP
ncbi:MAG: prepilin-type N-terminal cleavage/methylation domain-containing protein [Thiobacillaceae bacterium]